MANYFYVKSGGSLGVNDDTGFSSEQADSFTNIGAANYYDSIAAAVSDGSKSPPASDGDFVLVSDQHSKAHDFGTDPFINNSGSEAGVGLHIISVDDTDTSVYLPGADETLNDGADDFRVMGSVLLAGITIGTDDNALMPNKAGNFRLRMLDSILGVTGSTDIAIWDNVSKWEIALLNTDINCGNSGCVPIGQRSGTFKWNGGTVTGTGPTALFHSTLCATTTNLYAEITGVDLSLVSSALYPTTTVYQMLVKLTNCKLHASVSFPTAFTVYGSRFEMYNCDDAAGVFHRFYIADKSGYARNNDVTYVTATESWYEGSAKSSIEVVTSADCNKLQPFIFELPAQYVNLASTDTDTLTIDLVTDQTLTDTDIAAFLVYPDGTTVTQANWVTSGKTVGTGNYGVDPLAAGTELDASALGVDDWELEPTSPNFYEMVLDTSGAAGQATAVSVRIEVYIPSIAAGELFIHPLITVSAT